MTEKLLARKEGRIGFVTFNNPERHNAMSLEMWEATVHHLNEYAKDPAVRVLVLTGAGGKAFVSGRRHLQVRGRAFQQGWHRALQCGSRAGLCHRAYFPEAHHRHDPRLLHRRRHGPRLLLRHPHLLAEFALRGARPPSSAWATTIRASSGWWTWSDLPSPRRFSSRRGSSTQPRPRTWASRIELCRRRRSRPM